MYVWIVYELMCVCDGVGGLLFCILYLYLKYSLNPLKNILTFYKPIEIMMSCWCKITKYYLDK